MQMMKVMMTGVGSTVAMSVNENGSNECVSLDQMNAPLFDSPLAEALCAFGLDLRGAASTIDAGDPVDQCFAALSPDVAFLSQCGTFLPTVFGTDGAFTELHPLIEFLEPIFPILKNVDAQELLAALPELIAKISPEYVSTLCTALQGPESACLDAFFVSLGNWIDEAGDCCAPFTSMILPAGRTWSEFFASLGAATANVVCLSPTPCAEDDNTTCGVHVLGKFTEVLRPQDKDSILTTLLSYLQIGNGEGCDAFSGNPFTTTTGATMTLMDFGCICSKAIVDLTSLLIEIPLVSMHPILSDVSCGSGQCFQITTDLDECSCAADGCGEWSDEDTTTTAIPVGAVVAVDDNTEDTVTEADSSNAHSQGMNMVVLIVASCMALLF